MARNAGTEGANRRACQSRARRSVAAVVTLLAVACGGCSSWAQAPHELERAGGKTYSQVQVMTLVADAALRPNPPTVSLQVMLDDAARTLSQQHDEVAGLDVAGGDHRKIALLQLTDRIRGEVGPLRSAVDHGDHQRLRRIQDRLEPIASELESLGLS